MLVMLLVKTSRRTRSKRENVIYGFVILASIVLVWIGETSGALQPNLTSAQSWGENQIKVTWQPFEHVDNDEHYYELYIDDSLEYFGHDVMYIARRLTPDTIYHFKLRLCRQETSVCSPFSRTLAGSTDRSRKRVFTRSFIHWTIFCLLFTILACVTALVGSKIFRRLWRKFLYKYDYRSETDLSLPIYAATDVIDEDAISEFCLKVFPMSEQVRPEKPDSKFQSVPCSKSCPQNKTCSDLEAVWENVSDTGSTFKSSASINKSTQRIQFGTAEGFRNGASYSDDDTCDLHRQNDRNPFSMCQRSGADEGFGKSGSDGQVHGLDFVLKKTLSHSQSHSELTKTTNLGNKKQDITPSVSSEETKGESSLETSFFRSVPAEKEKFSEVIIVVDNSNIFIGAQECAVLHKPNERKRNVRVKIQQLVKVFERGRTVTKAFVQGSSPPTSEQVWEVYRRLGYRVDVEERRGKDEQRVDEGLHLHIYKALCELSRRTLVIASGDGNRGKSEGATSLPGCAEAAVERGWLVEVYSWQHSLSTEWLKLSKKYPDQLKIHFLDRYISHITFVDGKHGRKCLPFPTDFFKEHS